MVFTLRIAPAASPEAQALIAELDIYLTALYPGYATNGIVTEDFESRGGVFMLGRVDDALAGCGAFRPHDDAAEIKRLYVRASMRGRGVARTILRRLEHEAREAGFARGLLETGTRQPESIALYRAEGWLPIAPFGSYDDNPFSVCFAKRFDGDASTSP